MCFFDNTQMVLERNNKALGKHSDAVLHALTVADDDQVLGKVHVLDPQADAFHQAEARTIEQLRHQQVGARQVSHNPADLVFGEHRG